MTVARQPATDRSVVVVLPTLGDRIDTLSETLESVAGQRAEVTLTLAVVVPREAEQARELASAHGAVVLDDPRDGISQAINIAVDSAPDAAYYAWIGDDDLFRPGGLRALVDLLEPRPDAVLAFGGCDFIDEAGRTLVTNRSGRLARLLLPWGPDLIPHPGSLIRLDAMRRVGPFDRHLKYAMDLDMFLRLRREGRFLSTKRTVSAFRWHPDSLTVANRAASSAEAERVKKAHLPRSLRPVSPLWHVPVRWASARAAGSISVRARRVAEQDVARGS